MKTIEDLKKGDKIYDIDPHRASVNWYTYLCIHPTGGGHYHILINNCEEPLRIYHTKLKDILNKGLNSYDDARIALADKLESYANELRKR